MLPVRLRLKRKGLSGRELNQTFRQVNAAGMEAMGNQFYQRNLPRRFTYAGGKMLNYAPRNPKYTARKKAVKGHIDPLTYSGTSRALATRIKDVRVKSTNTRTTVTVRISRARGLNRRNPHSKINMLEEVTRIADREHGPLLRTARHAIRQELAKVNRR